MDKIKWEAGESRKEEGCQGFVVMKDTKDERTYHLYETYNDKAAADAHLETEHFKVIWALKEAGKFDVVSSLSSTINLWLDSVIITSKSNNVGNFQ